MPAFALYFILKVKYIKEVSMPVKVSMNLKVYESFISADRTLKFELYNPSNSETGNATIKGQHELNEVVGSWFNGSWEEQGSDFDMINYIARERIEIQQVDNSGSVPLINFDLI